MIATDSRRRDALVLLNGGANDSTSSSILTVDGAGGDGDGGKGELLAFRERKTVRFDLTVSLDNGDGDDEDEETMIDIPLDGDDDDIDCSLREEVPKETIWYQGEEIKAFRKEAMAQARRVSMKVTCYERALHQVYMACLEAELHDDDDNEQQHRKPFISKKTYKQLLRWVHACPDRIGLEKVTFAQGRVCHRGYLLQLLQQQNKHQEDVVQRQFALLTQPSRLFSRCLAQAQADVVAMENSNDPTALLRLTTRKKKSQRSSKSEEAPAESRGIVTVSC